MARDEKKKSAETATDAPPSVNEAQTGAKVRKPRGPRKTKTNDDALTAEDYASFAEANEQLIRTEKAKGEAADDKLMEQLFLRRRKLKRLGDAAGGATPANPAPSPDNA